MIENKNKCAEKQNKICSEPTSISWERKYLCYIIRERNTIFYGTLCESLLDIDLSHVCL